MAKKIISFHIGTGLHTEVQRLQGEALLEGNQITQQDVLRALISKGLKELAVYHERKVRVAWVTKWIRELKD